MTHREIVEMVDVHPRAYAVTVMQCDCCTDVTVHLGLLVSDEVGPAIIDVTFTEPAARTLIDVLGRALRAPISATDGQVIAEPTWHGNDVDGEDD
jgi:hypothetical protein